MVLPLPTLVILMRFTTFSSRLRTYGQCSRCSVRPRQISRIWLAAVRFEPNLENITLRTQVEAVASVARPVPSSPAAACSGLFLFGPFFPF
jgi:hypothetical protein